MINLNNKKAKLNQDNKYDDQIRKIKLEYEVKIRTLQSDLAKYEQIKAKNVQMLKNALESERQLEQLRREIVDMKKLKVKLMNQLKEEAQKSKMEEQKRQREIAALKRDHLRKDNQIRSLEAEKRCREIVLKRKQEQIQVRAKENAFPSFFNRFPHLNRGSNKSSFSREFSEIKTHNKWVYIFNS